MNASDEIEDLNANYMETMVPGKTNLPSTTTTVGTGTIMIKQKINRKSYKTELKAMTGERNGWRKAFKAVSIGLAGYILIDILYGIFG